MDDKPLHEMTPYEMFVNHAEGMRELAYQTNVLSATDSMLSKNILWTREFVKALTIAERQQRAIDLLWLVGIVALSLLVIDLHWDVCETWVDYVFFFLGPNTIAAYGAYGLCRSLRRGAEAHSKFEKARAEVEAAMKVVEEAAKETP